MAPDASCLFLVVLLSAGCEVTTSTSHTCIEKEVNTTYNCENLGLSELPNTLPNTTETLEFSFNFLPTIQATTFSRLTNLIFLDVTRCQINWIHENALQSHPQLSTLVLTGNPLIFVAETAFDGPRALKHLFLIQTGISSLEFIPAHNLKSLESLHLGSNYISSIKFPKDFPTGNLKVLDFQNNAIHYISRGDTDYLRPAANLSLNLRGNDIKGIQAGAFESMVLQSLNFGGAGNLSIIFSGLHNATIQSLWLGSYEDNEDQDLTSSMFEGLCEMSVESMNLQIRYFASLSSATFQCFTRLQELDLTDTHLEEMPLGIPRLTSLRKLVLSVNRFEQLCQINAASFPSLTHLYIKGNRKRLQLGDGCLEKLENLQKLDLSHSDIEALDCCNEQLKTLPHLKSLNLSYNQALDLQNEAFRACPRLELLDLTFTQLHINAAQSPFQNLQLLQALNLSHCSLNTHNQQLLAGLPNLRHLNLQGNSFQNGNIPKTNPLQMLGSLESLVLSSCGLSSIDQEAFHSLGNVTHIDLSHNNLTSSSISALSQFKGIYLNLATNSIRIIPPHLLPILSQQSIIDLSHNPLDCTCSNIHFLTWYKENLQKFVDFAELSCASPPSLQGVRLSGVTLSCGLTAMGIFFLTVFLLFLAVLLIYMIKFFFRWKYQHI